MDLDAAAKAFVEHYYPIYDGNRTELANLYHGSLMPPFEGQKIQGSRGIVAKLTIAFSSNSASTTSPPIEQLMKTINGLVTNGGVNIYVT
ncbi:hypothetical protein ACSBR1_025629 [Camellia fascicularis]